MKLRNMNVCVVRVLKLIFEKVAWMDAELMKWKCSVSTFRFINYPARGIGKTTVDKLVLVANEQNISMWDVLCNAAMHGFKAGTLSSIDEFVIMIKSFASMLTKQNAYEVSFNVGKQTNLLN